MIWLGRCGEWPDTKTFFDSKEVNDCKTSVECKAVNRGKDCIDSKKVFDTIAFKDV